MEELTDLEAGTIADELWEKLKNSKDIENIALDAQIDYRDKKMIDHWS